MDPVMFKKRFLIGAGIVTASLIIFVGAAFFLGNDITTQASAITAARSNAADQSAMVNAYSVLKSDAATAATYQAAMDKLLPSQNDLIGFQSQIDNIAHNDGVDLTFTFSGSSTPPVNTAPGSIGFTLSAIGPLQSIINFLSDIESRAPIALSKFDAFTVTQEGSNYGLDGTGHVFFR